VGGGGDAHLITEEEKGGRVLWNSKPGPFIKRGGKRGGEKKGRSYFDVVGGGGGRPRDSGLWSTDKRVCRFILGREGRKGKKE